VKDGKKQYVWLAKHKVPQFYGIPKIHSTPVKMRPIVPCFAAIQNPAAKFCSKRLKPIVQSAPTIIHGSKDLAIKLSKVKINRHRRKYIVTGDVVAFYPNIPIQQCIDVVSELHAEFYGIEELGNVTGDEETLRLAEIFEIALRLANTDLITQYKGKHYEQTRGLAMGVADSPDLANLYGWYFERRCGILTDADVPIYGRYIDDCFAVVYADSEQAALNKVKLVEFDGCVIKWNAGLSQPFLDMTVYVDQHGDVEHMPYRKMRSHQERIPWISHHPLDVKRGTFIGEMSRLATLSSLFTHYKDAIDGLCGLYIKRGYPSDLVMHWMRDNFSKRWENRLTIRNKGGHDDVLVLKSEFNTAWNYFNSHELGDTVLGYWRTWFNQADNGYLAAEDGYYRFDGSRGGLDLVDPELCSEYFTGDESVMLPDIRKLDILQRRVIVSRKRTRNFFDLTSQWKQTVIRRLEENVLEDQFNDAPLPPAPTTLWEESDGRDIHLHLKEAVDEDDMEYVANPSYFFQDKNYIEDL
jgi:hypothetical protein